MLKKLNVGLLLLCWHLFCLIVFFTSTLFAQNIHFMHFNVQKLTDGIFAVIHNNGGGAICNSGIIDVGDKTIIFDTFLSLDAANDLKNVTTQLTQSPVTYVINSHAHNDHIRGNQVFSPPAHIISTQPIKEAMQRDELNNIKQENETAAKQVEELQKAYFVEKDYRNRETLLMWLGYYKAMVKSNPHIILTLPTITFEEKMTIHGTDRKAELLQFKNGHTEDDIVLYLPDDKILFTGDLVFIDMHPYLVDGDPQIWVRNLEEMLTLEIDHVIPGHGGVGTKYDIQTMIRYIKMIEELAKTIIANEQSLDDIKKQPIPAPFQRWWFENLFLSNLEFMVKYLSQNQI